MLTDCEGSESGLAHTHSGKPSERYDSYRKMYVNCTHVRKNLEIVFINHQKPYNFEFLTNIREVTGYVLIVGNTFDRFRLPNLRVIRGRTLYFEQNTEATWNGTDGEIEINTRDSAETKSKRGYSLYVAINYEVNSTTIGLKEISLPSLHGNTEFLYRN